VEPVRVSGGAAELGGGQALFTPIASIEPGAEITLQIIAKADRPGSHAFRAEVRCTDPETKLASEQTNRFFGSATTSSADDDEAPTLTPSSSARPLGKTRK
jgi:hypothetical protein